MNKKKLYLMVFGGISLVFLVIANISNLAHSYGVHYDQWYADALEVTTVVSFVACGVASFITFYSFIEYVISEDNT